MDNLEFAAQKREKSEVMSLNQARKQGFLPGNIYGGTTPAISVYLDKKNVIKQLSNPSLYNDIYKVSVNKKTEEVLVREIQFNPLRGADPIHINFLRVDKSTVTRINIPIVYVNQIKSPGLKMGGVLNIVTHTLEVSCNPKNAPKQISVDLGESRIGSVIKVKNVELPKGVKTFFDQEFALASITASVSDEQDDAETNKEKEG